MKPITIVGAGFSGLTLAFELTELGCPVEVVDKNASPGGMIQTLKTEHGLVETAANAVMANEDIEALFKKLGLSFAATQSERRKRFIFSKGRARRWPLSWATTLRLALFIIKFKLSRRSVQPRPGETVGAWARRMINAEFELQLLAPAFQGVYAAQAKDLSAQLVLGRLLGQDKSPAHGRARGSSAPPLGMGEWMIRLAEELKRRNVAFTQGEYRVPEAPPGPVVICTSAWDAAHILKETQPSLAEVLSTCESLPLVTATLFFTPKKTDLKGFGCLFPINQSFHSLGVLFNDSIFAGRSAQRSETWILGGATHSQMLALSDEQILERIHTDRIRLLQTRDMPLSWRITRWPRAIPYYSVEWAQSLARLQTRSPFHLHGNYLGALGLAQIHQRSKRLAFELKERYG